MGRDYYFFDVPNERLFFLGKIYRSYPSMYAELNDRGVWLNRAQSFESSVLREAAEALSKTQPSIEDGEDTDDMAHSVEMLRQAADWMNACGLKVAYLVAGDDATEWMALEWPLPPDSKLGVASNDAKAFEHYSRWRKWPESYCKEKA